MSRHITDFEVALSLFAREEVDTDIRLVADIVVHAAVDDVVFDDFGFRNLENLDLVCFC